jgi:hypothetical protein
MKNKRLTYLLGIIVLAVWGIVIYRIFYAVGGNDDDDMEMAAPVQVKEPYNDFALPKDTTLLLINYRDPFGLTQFKDTTKKITKNDHHKQLIVASSKPAVDWSFIKYSGYIQNPVSKKLIALVTINGKNEMLSEGESKDNVKLVKNMKDEIKISFNGDTKLIPIRSAQ